MAVHDEAGTVVRWFGTSTDIHEQKRAEESARYLAEASAALAGVVDYESTLQKVANLAVPYFADWSAVDVADDDGSLRRLAVAHQDPEKVALAHELMRQYPPDPDAPGGGLRRPPHRQAGDRRRDHRRHARAGGEGRAAPGPDPLAGPEVLHLRAAGRLRQPARRPHVRHRRVGPQVHRGRPRPGDGPGPPGGGRHREHPAVPGAAGADRRKDEFLATLAHELRNPLAPIRNALQIMHWRGGRAAVEAARAMMERQVQHMVRLVDDLLDVSRITGARSSCAAGQLQDRAVLPGQP